VTVRGARRVAAVQGVRLEVGMGEIVGVAGVDGSGQRELAEALVGLRRLETGRLFLAGIELTRLSARQRQRAGLAYIPEDRQRAGLILDFTVAENYLLGHEQDPAWGGGVTLNAPTLLARAAGMIQRYGVRAPYHGEAQPARTLSGGNQQKVVIARAVDSGPRLLVACQPTRGLDVEAARFVYRTLRQARERGLGVLLFSLDLDEIFELSDRIAVLFNGRLAGALSRAQATPERVGALMTGAAGPGEATAPQPTNRTRGNAPKGQGAGSRAERSEERRPSRREDEGA
jgi:simple sugar transport system ATP-binding protein